MITRKKSGTEIPPTKQKRQDEPKAMARTRAPSRKKLASNGKNAPLSLEEVTKLAYFIYMEEGCPQGREKEHWLEAERRLQEKTHLKANDSSLSG
jgi:hypothetical protein